uniref:Ig-like domain-containing protein n=1 Tax=Cyclopterus lumpus TaxID=8103 RepID=A0A8C2X271_CYCLU
MSNKCGSSITLRCSQDTVMLYSTIGGDALLPCISPVPLNCASITWTFYQQGPWRYTEEVSEGRVKADSDKSGRLAIAPNCSLALRGLVVDDVGSYNCMAHGQSITAVYVSLLGVTSPSAVTELQPGGRLALSCILFTYYDSMSICGSRTVYVGLSQHLRCEEHVTQCNTVAHSHVIRPRRHELISGTSCNITLVIELKREDNNRMWRCQVSGRENSRSAFLDFTSPFVFQKPPSSSIDDPVQLPVSRIALCVALPVMVLIVGFFTWRQGLKRAKASA